MWIEVHEELPQHRKTYALADALGITNAHAVGLLVSFWTWAIRNAMDGDVTRFPERAISAAAGWQTKKGVLLIESMISCGWIDEEENRRMIHDWYEYAGRMIEQTETRRMQSRERQKKRREKIAKIDVCHDNVTRDTSVTNGKVTRDVTQVSRPVTHPTVTQPYRNPTNIENTEVDEPTRACARAEDGQNTVAPVETVDNSALPVDNCAQTGLSGQLRAAATYQERAEIARKLLYNAFGAKYAAETKDGDADDDIRAIAAMIAEEEKAEFRGKLPAQERKIDAINYIGDAVRRSGMACANAEYPAAYVRATITDWKKRGIRTYADITRAAKLGGTHENGLSEVGFWEPYIVVAGEGGM